MSKKAGIGRSIGFALEGVKEAFRNEPNFRIHTVFALGTLLAAFFLGFTRLELALLLLTISFVLIAELINTVLEKVVDIASPQISSKAKIAKDVSAAMVLLASILASLVGLILFGPKVLRLLNY